jgi:hypothetical protein
MLNLSPTSLESVNKDRPTDIEAAASALAAAERLARQAPTDKEAHLGVELARVEMLHLLTRRP